MSGSLIYNPSPFTIILWTSLYLRQLFLRVCKFSIIFLFFPSTLHFQTMIYTCLIWLVKLRFYAAIYVKVKLKSTVQRSQRAVSSNNPRCTFCSQVCMISCSTIGQFITPRLDIWVLGNLVETVCRGLFYLYS